MKSASPTTEPSTRDREWLKLTIKLASPEGSANIDLALPNLLIIPRLGSPASHLQLPRRIVLDGKHRKPKLGIPLRVLTALDVCIGLERLPVQSDLRVWILFIERMTVVEVPSLENYDGQRSEFLAHSRTVGKLVWGCRGKRKADSHERG